MIKANGTAIKIEVISMAECCESSRGLGGSVRVTFSVKAHAACGVEELHFFIGSLAKRDLRVTKIVTAKQTQFGRAEW